jgi:hypothetical protein
MVQVATEGREAAYVARTRPNRGDLQWLIPVRIENEDLHEKGAVLFPVSVEAHRIPHFFMATSFHALTNPNREAVRLRSKPVSFSGTAVDLKGFVVLDFEGWVS